jgi:uncharacterized protein YjdB
LVSISISPAVSAIGVGATQQLAAIGTYSDASTKDITSAVQWNSSNANIVSISAGGLASGVSSGTVVITAQYGSVQTTVTLKVTVAAANLVSIAVSPAASSIPVNTTQQFTATGSYSDGSSADLTSLVSWSSSTTATATIDNTGLATAAASGTTTITASFAGVTGSTGLTVTAPTIVSITVTPGDLTVGIGITQQFTATATYSDGSSADLTGGVSWTSSDSTVVTVNSSGVATTVSAGSATVTATVGSFSDTSTLTVVPAHLVSISVAPATQSIAVGSSQQFSAVGNFDDGSMQLLPSVTWSSSSPAFATIDGNGVATGLSAGTVTISATSGAVTGSASLTVTAETLVSIAVTPANSSMAVGTAKQFTATGTFSDNSTQDLSATVVWTSSNPAFATINNQGLVTSIASGSTTIAAAFGSINGSTGLTVSTVRLVSITINPASPRIQKGTSIKFTASGTFSDGSTVNNLTGVSWRSSKPNIARVRTSGVAYGKKGGNVTITASSSGVSGTTTLTVGTGTLVSVAVTPSAPTAAAGGTQQFTATGTFSDGSTQDVTANSHWSSSSSVVATIVNSPSGSPGLANCRSAGTSTIGSNSGGITGSAVLTVQ